MRLKASAPGSLMLLGEHAVLHGKKALVSAINKRITVKLIPRNDDRIIITSALGNYSTRISDIQIEKPFAFILSALQSVHDDLQQGCELTIESEFSDTIGLGSSAAITVATLSVLSNWLGIHLSPLELVERGRDIVRKVQGVGSGADIAASVYGGMVAYSSDPVTVETIQTSLPLHVIYSGYKTKTADVIQHVQNSFANNKNKFHDICERIGQCVINGISCLRKNNLTNFGEIMNTHQEFMQELGVSSDFLEKIIMDLRKQDNILGVKISGSGLGDCVIALGELPDHYECVIEDNILQRIPVAISLQGVLSEKT